MGALGASRALRIGGRIFGYLVVQLDPAPSQEGEGLDQTFRGLPEAASPGRRRGCSIWIYLLDSRIY